MKEIMKPGHPRWEEFCLRLSGPEGCNFRLIKTNGEFEWDCDCEGINAFLRTAEILNTMPKISIDLSIKYFKHQYIFCDCDILFDLRGGPVGILEVMTPDHPRWEEFLHRLEGTEGCNFRIDEGKAVWDCEDGMTNVVNILGTMLEIDIKSSIEFFNKNGAFCDCDIIFYLG